MENNVTYNVTMRVADAIWDYCPIVSCEDCSLVMMDDEAKYLDGTPLCDTDYEAHFVYEGG